VSLRDNFQYKPTLGNSCSLLLSSMPAPGKKDPSNLKSSMVVRHRATGAMAQARGISLMLSRVL
jgi:hypothetical protein